MKTETDDQSTVWDEYAKSFNELSEKISKAGISISLLFDVLKRHEEFLIGQDLGIKDVSIMIISYYFGYSNGTQTKTPTD